MLQKIGSTIYVRNTKSGGFYFLAPTGGCKEFMKNKCKTEFMKNKCKNGGLPGIEPWDSAIEAGVITTKLPNRWQIYKLVNGIVMIDTYLEKNVQIR